MTVNCDFRKELTMWPHWVCHLPPAFHLKRTCHIVCQIVCLFCMLLAIWGYSLETQFLVSAACSELVPASNLDKSMSYEKSTQSTNVKTHHKSPSFLSECHKSIASSLTCNLHRKVNLSTYSILLYTTVQSNIRKMLMEIRWERELTTLPLALS